LIWMCEEYGFSPGQLSSGFSLACTKLAKSNALRNLGELIVFIDSDDALLPNHIETAVNVFREFPNIGLFCCDSTLIDAEGAVLFDGRTWHEIQSEQRKQSVQTGFRTLSNIFAFSHIFPGFTLPKAVFEKVGDFDQSIFPMDDYDLMLRVAGAGYNVYYHGEPLALRREHSGQCSGVANSIDTCEKQLRALHAALKRNPELRTGPAAIKRRLASAKLELALSRMIAGERAAGLGTLIQAVAADPSQLIRVAHLGRGRLRRLVAAA